MAMHLPQEPDHIRGASVVVEQSVVQSESFRPRRAGKRRQRRDAIVSFPSMLDRRLANGSPHPPPQRLKQIATFVQENQASFTFEALFLAAAIRRGATGRWPVRRARGRVAPASVDSIRFCAGACRRSPRCMAPQTVGESGLGPADKSSPNASSPSGSFPVSAQPEVPRVARATVLSVGQDADGPVMSHCRRVSIVPSNEMRRRRCTRSKQPLPSTFSLARKAGLQSFDELPAPRDCLMVSCPQRTQKLEQFPLTT